VFAPVFASAGATGALDNLGLDVLDGIDAEPEFDLAKGVRSAVTRHHYEISNLIPAFH